MSCGVGLRCMLLWLWCRLAAVGPIQPLAWELPNTTGVALKRHSDKQTNKQTKNLPVCCIFPIHSSIDGLVGCFHVLALVNIATGNVAVPRTRRDPVFLSLGGWIPRSGMAGPHGHSLSHPRGTILLFSSIPVPAYTPSSCARGRPFSPHPHQRLSLLVFLMTAIPTGGGDISLCFD